jgi:hypothetical protein
MRYLLMVAVLLLAALWVQPEAAAQKKGEAATKWAKVTVGGEIRDLIELRAKYNLLTVLDREVPGLPPASQWPGPQPLQPLQYQVRSMQIGETAWIVVLLDETGSDLKALLPKLRPGQEPVQVVFDGMFAAAPLDREPFVTHANGTGKLRIVGKGDKAALGVGEIRVEGQALPGKFEVSKGTYTTLAIANGTSPILVTGKAIEPGAPPKAKLRVTGKLALQKQGPLVVEAHSIAVEQEPPAIKKPAK